LRIFYAAKFGTTKTAGFGSRARPPDRAQMTTM
jgi:hypothetical protein